MSGPKPKAFAAVCDMAEELGTFTTQDLRARLPYARSVVVGAVTKLHRLGAIRMVGEFGPRQAARYEWSEDGPPVSESIEARTVDGFGPPDRAVVGVHRFVDGRHVGSRPL